MDQITESLWIGDIYDVQQRSTSRFDAIITICQDNVGDNVGCEQYDHYPLSDGPPPSDAYNPGEFSYDLFEDAVNRIIDHVENETTTLVHCHAGQSRSAMAITAALTTLTDMSYTEAFNTVSNARTGGISPSRELQEFAQQYADA